MIAGQYRGRRLKTPSWTGLRPTSDKLRETLFNILAPRIAGARLLDAFAGTGAVGIEALSRGASHVTFVDVDRRALALIEANLAICGIEEGYTIERGDLVTVLHRLPHTVRFDLIVLYPPYDAAGVAELAGLSAERLESGGLLVLERATRREVATPQGLTRVRDVRSGDSTLTFLRLD